ncbi:YwaF family protein [Jongsikchunia kroppenstedtii]|uniref:YwaF family protein n=1 Tax=Jongsikchunia kroppenstedtii TaxID=1121721 RepID=UPI00036726F7|nr:TIGR02206 family membrane protein [Jongsikchunia kroppenstedtii]
MTVSPYWMFVAAGALACAGLCIAARRRPGPWVTWAGRAIAVVLATDAVFELAKPIARGDWSVKTSLPLALCSVAGIVAIGACWFRDWQLGAELTYFWGLTGTLQAVATPDLYAEFPQLEFFLFVIGHIGIVFAAVFLVVGQHRTPRPNAAPRVFVISLGYTVFVGAFDWLTGSNYMFLRALPGKSSLLSVLGPWPWYIVSAAGVAAVMLLLLDMPFRLARRGRIGPPAPFGLRAAG